MYIYKERERVRNHHAGRRKWEQEVARPWGVLWVQWCSPAREEGEEEAQSVQELGKEVGCTTGLLAAWTKEEGSDCAGRGCGCCWEE